MEVICMKKTGMFLLAMMLCLGMVFSCSAENRTILPPGGYPTSLDDEGADAYNGALDHTDSRYYQIVDYFWLDPDENLRILPQFRTYQQTTEYTCGAASALMVLVRFGVETYDEMALAEAMKTDPEKGTTVEGLAGFFESLGWTVDSHADTEYRFEDIDAWRAYLAEQLDAGVPVMVDWEDWAGHWQVIVGLDSCGTEDPYDDVLILADPYDITDHCQDGYYIFPFGRFFDMWREGPCAAKEAPYVQPFVAAKP